MGSKGKTVHTRDPSKMRWESLFFSGGDGSQSTGISRLSCFCSKAGDRAEGWGGGRKYFVQWDWFIWSKYGSNNDKVVGSVPVWAILLRAGLNDFCGSFPVQNVLVTQYIEPEAQLTRLCMGKPQVKHPVFAWILCFLRALSKHHWDCLALVLNPLRSGSDCSSLTLTENLRCRN